MHRRKGEVGCGELLVFVLKHTTKMLRKIKCHTAERSAAYFSLNMPSPKHG